MLRIAVQSKGRLFEETMALLQEAFIMHSTGVRNRHIGSVTGKKMPATE